MKPVAIISLTAWCTGWLRRNRRWSSRVAFLLTIFVFTAICILGTTALNDAMHGAAPSFTREGLLIVSGQAVMTALWSGGLWFAVRIVSGAFRRVVPPLDWRKVARS